MRYSKSKSGSAQPDRTAKYKKKGSRRSNRKRRSVKLIAQKQKRRRKQTNLRGRKKIGEGLGRRSGEGGLARWTRRGVKEKVLDRNAGASLRTFIAGKKFRKKKTG